MITKIGFTTLFFLGGSFCLLTGGCSTIRPIKEIPIARLAESGIGNYFEYVLTDKSIYYVARKKSKNKKIILSSDEVNKITKQLIDLEVNKWLPDYGSWRDPLNKEYLTNIMTDGPTGWSAEFRFEGERHSSKGWGMFPSNEDYLTPSGPIETERYEAAKNVFYEALRKHDSGNQ